MSAFACGPVGKISIDFFFVSGQLGLSGPFVGSIILAHYHAHTVADQWGNESLSLQWVCARVCVCVCVCTLQETHLQICHFLQEAEKCFMTLWSINSINQNVKTAVLLEWCKYACLHLVCVCVCLSKLLSGWAGDKRLKTENKTWRENWICSSNCEHKSSGGKKSSKILYLSKSSNTLLNYFNTSIGTKNQAQITVLLCHILLWTIV